MTPQKHSFTEGDVVAGYYKGIFKLTKIIQRTNPMTGKGPYSDLHEGVIYDPIKGKLGKSPRQWDSGYTRPILADLDMQIAKVQKELEKLDAQKKALI